MRNLLAGLLLTLLPAIAGSADSVPEDDRAEFVLGNIAFVLLHEFGHLVIDDFDIPLLGNPEDAADTLAAVTLVRMDRNRPESDFRYIRMLLMAADANRILWERGIERDNPAVYLARHPLSVQRATRIACLVYGSDTELLAALPDIVGIPPFRANWCAEEFAAAETAWEWVAEEFIDSSERQERDHRFGYGSPQGPEQEKIRARMEQAEMLERTLELLSDNILLPDSILLRTSSCGSPDAYWDSESREVVLCYELIQGFYNLSEEQKVRDVEAQLRELNEDAA